MRRVDGCSLQPFVLKKKMKQFKHSSRRYWLWYLHNLLLLQWASLVYMSKIIYMKTCPRSNTWKNKNNSYNMIIYFLKKHRDRIVLEKRYGRLYIDLLVVIITGKQDHRNLCLWHFFLWHVNILQWHSALKLKKETSTGELQKNA